MNTKEYALLTFKSTHLALQGEVVFEENDIDFKTIPTPREVSHSCGLALLFSKDEIDKIKDMLANKLISIDGLYLYSKDGKKNIAEKLL